MCSCTHVCTDPERGKNSKAIFPPYEHIIFIALFDFTETHFLNLKYGDNTFCFKKIGKLYDWLIYM